MLTAEQIQRMFDDFGLNDENKRDQFRQIEALAGQESRVKNFIRLDDTSLPQQREDDLAKLA